MEIYSALVHTPFSLLDVQRTDFVHLRREPTNMMKTGVCGDTENRLCAS